MEQEEQVVSIDIGYGFTKAVATGKGTSFLCPSLVSPARNIRFKGDLSSGNDDITVQVDGGGYFVGDKAILQGRGAAQTLSNDRVGSVEQKALFFAACSDLVKVDTRSVTVVTGLPVSDFTAANRKLLAKSLKGDHIVARDGRSQREFTVKKVVVVPQAVGALYGMVLNKEGKAIGGKLAAGRVAVIDIGQLTVNYVTFDALNYVDYLSTSGEHGVSRILLDLQQDLRDEYGLNLDKLSLVDRVVREGSVTVRGKLINIESMINQRTDELLGLVQTQARGLWKNAADLSAIVLTGGGSALLADRLRDTYDDLLLVDKSGQFGNVRGYLRMALLKASRG